MKSKTPVMIPLLSFAVVLLFLAVLFKWPYGYYTFLRMIVFVISGLIAIAAYKLHRQGWMIALGLIAVLFNPFAPIHFDRDIWRVIDFAVGVVFLIFIFKIRKRKND